MLVRIDCCNPNETSFGKALTVLKSTFACQQMEDPQTFYSFMQELKSAVRAHVKKLPACKIHLTQYGIARGASCLSRKHYGTHGSVAKIFACQRCNIFELGDPAYLTFHFLACSPISKAWPRCCNSTAPPLEPAPSASAAKPQAFAGPH